MLHFQVRRRQLLAPMMAKSMTASDDFLRMFVDDEVVVHTVAYACVLLSQHSLEFAPARFVEGIGPLILACRNRATKCEHDCDLNLSNAALAATHQGVLAKFDFLKGSQPISRSMR